MPHRVVLKIAAPMIVMGSVLLALGVFAAWNVQTQHQASSDLIAREVRGLIATEDLHLQMREIRYQTNMFLRSRDPQHLTTVNSLHGRADEQLKGAMELPGAERDQELIREMVSGYQEFFDEFQQLSAPLLASVADLPPGALKRVELTPQTSAQFTRLSDDVLTRRVLEPLREMLRVNEEVVQRTNEAARDTAQHLKMGFLLLGICGAAAGLLLGTAIARTIGQSIVQLNVSVRGVAGKLTNVTGPVTFSHSGGLQGVESGLKQLEDDISQVVERLQQREVELLRSEQLARVGQLAAGLAHELRNPLMPMKMLVQSAIERGDDQGLKGRSLHIIDEEISRLEASIQSFLDFARPPTLEMAPAEIQEIIEYTLKLVSARASQQAVELRVLLPEQPVVARVDRAQLRQLLLNLLLNALDALEAGGVVEVELQATTASPTAGQEPGAVEPASEPSELEPNVISLHAALRIRERPSVRSLPQQFAIIVRDNGPGISPEILSIVFDPFVTTKETGTGLGLPISQRIAAAHHGVLTARNREEGGAEFRLVMPYGMSAAGPAGEAAPATVKSS